MSQENPVNWVPDKLASLKKNPGLRSQLDVDRTQDDETVSRDRDWMGNNSRLNMRSKEYSVEWWTWLSREDQNPQLERRSYINRGANKSFQKVLQDRYFESGQ